MPAWQSDTGSPRLTAINAVKALRLDPETGRPYLKNRYGSMSGRAIKPIGLRIVVGAARGGHPPADHRLGGHPRLRRLPRVLLGRGGRVLLGCAVWLKPMPLYALGPIEGVRIRRLIERVAAFAPPNAAPHWTPGTAQGRSADQATQARPQDVEAAGEVLAPAAAR